MSAEEWCTPASNSSQFSIGVTSTATVGPKLDRASVKLLAAAPPSSTTARGSVSTDWAEDCRTQITANAMTNAGVYLRNVPSSSRVPPRMEASTRGVWVPFFHIQDFVRKPDKTICPHHGNPYLANRSESDKVGFQPASVNLRVASAS